MHGACPRAALLVHLWSSDHGFVCRHRSRGALPRARDGTRGIVGTLRGTDGRSGFIDAWKGIIDQSHGEAVSECHLARHTGAGEDTAGGPKAVAIEKRAKQPRPWPLVRLDGRHTAGNPVPRLLDAELGRDGLRIPVMRTPDEVQQTFAPGIEHDRSSSVALRGRQRDQGSTQQRGEDPWRVPVHELRHSAPQSGIGGAPARPAEAALDVPQRHAGDAYRVNLFAALALHAETSGARAAGRRAAVPLRDRADLFSGPP